MAGLTGGLDEVGWGAGAGPIVSCVVVMSVEDHAKLPPGVTDSKRVPVLKREMMFETLCTVVTDVGIGAVEPDEIDRMGPKLALQESYTRAIAELRFKPDLLIVDGSVAMNKVKSWKGHQMVVPKADLKHKEVSAASIIAKVVRDTVMAERGKYVQQTFGLDYNWAVNKGYLTPDHLAAMKKNGLLMTPAAGKWRYQHRKSYCHKLIEKHLLKTFQPWPP